MRGETGVDDARDWALDEGFVMLGRPVRIRATSSGCADLIRRLFGPGHAAVPDGAPTFALSERDASGRTAQLTRDDEVLIRNAPPADAFSLLVWQVMNDAVSDASD